MRVAGSNPAGLTYPLLASPYRLAGPGHRPFTAVTGVRIPLGTPLLPKVTFWHPFSLLAKSLSGDLLAYADLANHSATVAQLVEQLIRNQQVVGSSPVGGST